MLYRLGRLLQLLGLLLLPIAIAGNLAREDQVDLKTSLMLSSIGIAVFALGWLVQQSSRPK